MYRVSVRSAESLSGVCGFVSRERAGKPKSPETTPPARRVLKHHRRLRLHLARLVSRPCPVCAETRDPIHSLCYLLSSVCGWSAPANPSGQPCKSRIKQSRTKEPTCLLRETYILATPSSSQQLTAPHIRSHVWCRSWTYPRGPCQEPGAARRPVRCFVGTEGVGRRREGMTARACVHKSSSAAQVTCKSNIRSCVFIVCYRMPVHAYTISFLCISLKPHTDA